MRTRINGRWVVGYDETREGHVVYEDGVVVFEDDRIHHVGADYDGSADRRIEGPYLVVPGLVNLHAHLDAAIASFWYDRERGTDWTRPKSWIEDPDERPVFTPSDVEAAARHSMAVLLGTGTTTFADLTTFAHKRWDDPVWEPHVYAEVAGEMGLRAYLSHRFRSEVPYYEDGSRNSARDPERGERGFERALRFVDHYHGAYDDRIRTALFPYTLDSVEPDLLARTKAAADERGILVRTHAAQSTAEAELIERRHGMTPVEYLDDRGLLDDNVCLTHCMYPDGRTRPDGVPDPEDETLERIAETGTAVVYCPTVFRRSGGVMNSFSRYRAAGITMGLGTDTFPQNVFEELRWAALGTKIVETDPTAGSARELFDAVTVGGACALNRTDIGRLESGAKADVVCVDLSDLHASPVHDPIRALVHYATSADIAQVFVDGAHLVEDGSIPRLDERQVLSGAQRVHEKQGRTFADWKGADGLSEAFPPSYPVDPEFEREG